jgi:transcriptional regulator GlxA family with amidase domain
MHRVGLVLPPDFQLLNLAPLTVFEIAEMTPAPPAYRVSLLSERGGQMRSSCGVTVETEAFSDPDFDTLIVGAITSFSAPPPSSPGTIAFVQKAAAASRRTASFCNGAFILAEAGLLEGRRATTHWHQAIGFRARFPNIILEEDRIFIRDGTIWTSAGMTAGFDLVLAMVDEDVGPKAAVEVAKLLVMDQRRMGAKRQLSALLEMTPSSDRIELVLAYIRENLQRELSVDVLASVANLSRRQFGRAFMAETGQAPAKAVEKLRLEAARFKIEQGRLTVDQIAHDSGFGGRERMRRAFVRTYGQSPRAMRSDARTADREIG